jgi:hypothetical protein
MGSSPIVNQLAKILKVDRFDYGLPADVLLKHRDELLPKFSKKTFENFKALFEKLNPILNT